MSKSRFKNPSPGATAGHPPASSSAKHRQQPVLELAECRLRQPAQHLPNESLVNRQELAALHERRFWQTSRLPIFLAQPSVFRIWKGWKLRSDRQHDKIALPRIEVLGGDDDGGTLLRGGQIGERERQEDHVARLIDGRRERRQGSPRIEMKVPPLSGR